MSLASSDYGDTASTSSRTGTSTGSYGSSSGSGATDYYDADVRASAAISGSTASSTATDFSSQLIKTTESHWSVSGTSVIAAWGACLVGGVSGSYRSLLLYPARVSMQSPWEPS